MNALEKFQGRAKGVFDSIIEGGDTSEKELILLAASIIIKDWEPECLICEEISGAEMYLRKYQQDGDAQHLEFAKDELKHAKKPIAALAARLHTATPKEIELYNWAIAKIAEIEKYLL